jgi:hypothetical protein
VAGRNRGTGPLVCHGRQVLNGYREGTSAEARALTLARLNDPQTPARLRTLGVRYVVLNAARTFGPEVPAPGQPDPAFRLLATDGSHQLYEVGPRALKRSSGGSSGYERWRVGDPDAD